MRRHIKVLTGMLVASSVFGTDISARNCDIEVKYTEGVLNNKIMSRNTIDRNKIVIVSTNNNIQSQISRFKRRYRN